MIFRFKVLYGDLFGETNSYEVGLRAENRCEAMIKIINAHKSKKKYWDLLGIMTVNEGL